MVGYWVSSSDSASVRHSMSLSLSAINQIGELRVVYAAPELPVQRVHRGLAQRIAVYLVYRSGSIPGWRRAGR